MIQEHVRIIFEAVTKGMRETNRNFQNFKNGVIKDTGIMGRQFNQNFRTMRTRFDNFAVGLARQVPGLGIDQITSQLGRMNYEMRPVGNQIKVWDRLNQRYEKQGVVVKKLRQQTQRFHMELLSVGFGAMMLSGILLGLLQPAMKMSGILDLLNITLGVFFLPIIMSLMQFLMPIMEWFINMPEPTKKLIGAIVLLTGVFFALLSFMAFMGLFAFSIKIGLATITGAFAAASGPIGIIILAIIAALALLFLAWKNNWGNIRGIVANILNFLQPAFKMLGVALKILGEVFVYVWNIIARVMQIAWSIISIPLNFLWGILEGFIKSIFPDVEDAWSFLWNTIGKVLINAWLSIKPIFDLLIKALDWIISAIGTVTGGARGIGRAIGGAMGGAVRGYQRGGIVPGPIGHPYPAIVHGGEAIIPAGGVGNITFAPTIYIEAKEQVDIDRLKDQLSDEWLEQLKTMTRRI